MKHKETTQEKTVIL